MICVGADNKAMMPVIYHWLEDKRRQKLTVEFLVHCLPEKHFRPMVSQNGMLIELGIVVPEFFMSKC
jgi:hypothetical protein